MARKIIRGSGSMSLEEALNSPSYGKSYSIESVALDPAMSREVADVLTDTLSDNGFYFLGQAEVCAKEAWEWGNECQRLINERNQKIRTCRALASSRGGEALSYWKVMSTENEVSDFAKRVWDAIKNAIKKLILMVINFIKSVGNFIKGAICKAQDLFWKKYRREIESVSDKKSEGTMKIRSKSADKIWEKMKPSDYLRKISSTLVGGFATLAGQVNIASSGKDFNVSKIVNDIGLPSSDAVKAQTGKWFPSAAKVVNEATYGVEKPSKNEVKIETILSEGKELLDAACINILAMSLKCGQVASKQLSNLLKKVEQIEKVMIGERVHSKDINKYEGKAEKGANAGTVQDARRTAQFCTTLLLHAYGNCLSARMAVFAAARKKIRGSSKEDKKAAKEKATNKDATAKSILEGAS